MRTKPDRQVLQFSSSNAPRLQQRGTHSVGGKSQRRFLHQYPLWVIPFAEKRNPLAPENSHEEPTRSAGLYTPRSPLRVRREKRSGALLIDVARLRTDEPSRSRHLLLSSEACV